MLLLTSLGHFAWSRVYMYMHVHMCIDTCVCEDVFLCRDLTFVLDHVPLYSLWQDLLGGYYTDFVPLNKSLVTRSSGHCPIFL